MSRASSRLLLATAGLWMSAACFAQSSNNAATPQHPIDTRPEGIASPSCTYSASRSNGQTTGSSTCPDGASATKRFPYPGENQDYTLPATDQKQNAPPDGPQATPQNAAKRFPYPGETGTPAPASPLKDAGSSGESTSSSNSSSSSSSDAGLPPDDNNANSPDALPAPKRERKKLPPVPRQSPDEREQEDVKIAGFYQNDGNYRAAYMRAKDAVSLASDDADAQFALAEAARKLGKLDEAQKSYKQCLELDPVPKLRKAAEKALKDMSGS